MELAFSVLLSCSSSKLPWVILRAKLDEVQVLMASNTHIRAPVADSCPPGLSFLIRPFPWFPTPGQEAGGRESGWTGGGWCHSNWFVAQFGTGWLDSKEKIGKSAS